MDPKKFVDIVMREAGKIVHRIVCSICSSTVHVQLEVVSHIFILFLFPPHLPEKRDPGKLGAVFQGDPPV